MFSRRMIASTSAALPRWEINRDEAIAALRCDDQPPVMLDGAADTVPGSVGAAVQAGHRPQLRVEPHDEAVGAARRPRLVHAHRLDGAALQRLEEAAPRRQRRRDPLIA